MSPRAVKKINGVSFVAARDSVDSTNVSPVVEINANYAAIMPFGFIRNLDNPKIILVTSAFHMPRAQLVFEAAGISAIPFPVDFRIGAQKRTFMSFIPSASSFEATSFFVREMIGRTYYNLKY